MVPRQRYPQQDLDMLLLHGPPEEGAAVADSAGWPDCVNGRHQPGLCAGRVPPMPAVEAGVGSVSGW